MPSDRKTAYKKTLHHLQVELVKLQRHVIANNERVLVILEGRDAAGKDGAIKRFTAHLSPRETRVVALGKPSERDRSTWYFQRYTPYLPAADEIVLFNRSWYNRAGVERVMDFCSDIELDEFFETVVPFEHMLVRSGIRLFKYYLDISKTEQKARIEDRRENPLKQWKVSPIDSVAVKHWDDYSKARNEMLVRTHSLAVPWTIVKADDKHDARLALIRNFLSRMEYDGKDKSLLETETETAFQFDPLYVEQGLLEH